MREISKDSKTYRISLAAAILSTIIWGLFPIYWKNLSSVNDWIIVAYRILSSGIFSTVFVFVFHSREEIVKPLKIKGAVLQLVICGLIINVNWMAYIVACNTNNVIQTSLAYFIEPVIICFIGILFFGEKLVAHKSIAIFMTIVGLLVGLIHVMQVPVYALIIGSTFAIYGALKKKLKQPPLVTLFYENVIQIPFALCAIIFIESKGIGAIGYTSTGEMALLVLSGLISSLPLFLFTQAANHLPLITCGIVQYLEPTIVLLLGTLLYKEPFDGVQLISFGIIWVGIAVFTIGEYRSKNSMSRKE